MNENWIKFAKSSFANYLETFADSANLAFTIDQMESDAASAEANYLNFQPTINMVPIAGGQTKIIVVVQLVLHYLKDPTNMYVAEEYLGKILSALASCIPLLDDSDQVLGIFQFPTNTNTPIRTTPLINKDQTSRVGEIVFTASYEVIL